MPKAGSVKFRPAARQPLTKKRDNTNLCTRTVHGSSFVECPVCKKNILLSRINTHLDSESSCQPKPQSQTPATSIPHLKARSDRHQQQRVDLCEFAAEKDSSKPSREVTPETSPVIFPATAISCRSADSKCAVQLVNGSWKYEESELIQSNLPMPMGTLSSSLREGDAELQQEAKEQKMSSTCHGYGSSSGQLVAPLLLKELVVPRGLILVEEFISPEEEDRLLWRLESDHIPWRPASTNGSYMGKGFGMVYSRIRGVQQPLFRSMPGFLRPVIERMRQAVPQLKAFCPNDANAIDYRRADGHHLTAHADDRQISGEMIVNLSLLGDCFMKYEKEKGSGIPHKVLLKRRCLQVLTGHSRYSYTHAIENGDLLSPRRVSLTFRQNIIPK